MTPSTLVNYIPQYPISEPTASFWYGETGEYEVNFMQEAQPNLIYNPSFRVEKNDSSELRSEELRRLWQLTGDVSIYGGAANISGNGTLYQNLTSLRAQSIPVGVLYYTLKISVQINSGTCKLLYGNCWTDALFSPYLKYHSFPIPDIIGTRNQLDIGDIVNKC